jgi:hypothetical protein
MVGEPMKAGGKMVEVVRITIMEGRPAGSQRPAATRLRSMPTHNHPRIRCTQTAMLTAITKNSGSAAAKPTAFASISAPAFPPWARSFTAHIPITFRCLRSVRPCGAAAAAISVPRRSRIGSSGDCRAKARAGSGPQRMGDPRLEIGLGPRDPA